MATITNLTSGIEIDFSGAVTYIKHGNVKLLKRGNNINIYDDSDDDGNQRGQVYISIPFSEVTSPSTGDTVAVVDAANTFNTNNVTVGRNGSNIESSASDDTISAFGANKT